MIINPYIFVGAAPPSPFGGLVSTTDLVEWWPLSEASGTRVGVHAGLDLTDNNTVTGAAGVGSSLASQFTLANSEYLSRADESAFHVGDVYFEILGWMYLDTKATNEVLFSRYELNNNRSFIIYYSTTSDRFLFTVTSDGTSATAVSVLANTFGSPSIGTWYFIDAFHSPVGNTIQIAINGGAFDSTAHSAGVFAGTSPLMIGANPSSGTPINFHNGRAQRVGFWNNGTPSAAERTALYNSGNGLDY